MLQNEWIYDWNTATPPEIPTGTPVLLDDETLRDGLQNPSVFDPSIEDKLEILHLMESLGIDAVNIGLPGAGPRAAAHTEALAREIAANRMKIKPNCAARTHENDIRGDFRARRNRDRSRHVPWFEPHPAFGRRLDRRPSPAHHRKGGEVRGRTWPAVYVRDRRYRADGSGNSEALIFHGDW